MEQEEERRGGEEQATDIKSNNPHLAGGEKCLGQVKDHGNQSSREHMALKRRLQ